MKTILLACCLGLVPALNFAQNTGSYTNGINTIPPNETTTPRQPNYSVTTPDAYPSTYPTSPGTPPMNQIRRLFQDPARTPNNVKRSDPVTTVNGSSGKHRSQHKFTPAKKNGFVTNRRTKGVKGKTRVSREKSSD